MEKFLDYTFKTTMNNIETRNKTKKGAYFFEIQLMASFLEDSFDIKKEFEKFDKENIDVRTVHVPLTSKPGPNALDNGCLYLESLANKKYSEYFLKVCKLGQLFADYYNHDVKIIVHNGLRLENYLLTPCLLNELISLMNHIIDTCPKLIIEIENTTPMTIPKDGKYPFFTAGILSENVEVVKYLNKHCKKPIFRTVFDICHYLVTIRVLKLITNKDISLKELFEQHEEVFGTIHFSNVRNLGVNPGEHGCGYKEIPEDISLLKEILPLIEKYAYNADICLEITEKDYDNIPDVMETLRLVDLVKKEKI